jgi:hypothetical protein
MITARGGGGSAGNCLEKCLYRKTSIDFYFLLTVLSLLFQEMLEVVVVFHE